eukprot:Colp12_sorted_trinity150504_noHs@10019
MAPKSRTAEILPSTSIDSGYGEENPPKICAGKLYLQKIRTTLRAGSEAHSTQTPRGMTCDLIDGKLYICDEEAEKIIILNEDGSFCDVIEDNNVIAPVQVAVSENFVIVVHSYDQERLTWFDKQTKRIMSSHQAPFYGSFGGVCLSSKSDHVFASLPGENLLVELNSKGTVTRTFRHSQLIRPSSLKYDPNSQSVFACCDSTVEVVYVGSDEPTLTATYEGFSHPVDVCVDDKGSAIICDSGSNRVYVFDCDLELHRAYEHSKEKNSIGEGVVFDRRGRLWMVHAGSGSVVLYNLLATDDA